MHEPCSHQRKLLLCALKQKDMILGVSGWVGEKMGFSEQQVRIAFVISFFLVGVGVGLYLILWLVKIFSKD